MPFLRQVALLFEHCNKFGFEGVVSKRLSSPNVSWPSKWVKRNVRTRSDPLPLEGDSFKNRLAPTPNEPVEGAAPAQVWRPFLFGRPKFGQPASRKNNEATVTRVIKTAG